MPPSASRRLPRRLQRGRRAASGAKACRDDILCLSPFEAAVPLPPPLRLAAVYDIRRRSGAELREPESVPDAGGSEETAQDESGGNSYDCVAQQRNDERRRAHAEPFERAGGDNRNRRDDEAEADDPQRLRARADRLCVSGERAYQHLRRRLAEQRPDRHYSRRQREGRQAYTPDARVLPCAEVVADQRPHALHDAVGGKIEKSLQLIVNTEDDDVNLRILREDDIQRRNKQRRQREVQRRRHADGVEAARRPARDARVLRRYMHRQRVQPRQQKIHRERQHLPYAGRPRRALDSHRGRRAEAENHNRVEDDVRDAAAHHAEHRRGHAPDRLEDLLVCESYRDYHREGENNVRVAQAEAHHLGVVREHSEKRGHRRDADNC